MSGIRLSWIWLSRIGLVGILRRGIGLVRILLSGIGLVGTLRGRVGLALGLRLGSHRAVEPQGRRIETREIHPAAVFR